MVFSPPDEGGNSTNKGQNVGGRDLEEIGETGDMCCIPYNLAYPLPQKQLEHRETASFHSIFNI